MSPSFADLAHALMPELSLVVGALLVLGFDLAIGRRDSLEERMRTSAAIGAVAVMAAFIHCIRVGVAGPVFGGVLNLDSLALVGRQHFADGSGIVLNAIVRRDEE